MFVVDDEKQRMKMTVEFYANYKRDIEFYQKRIQNFIENGCDSKTVIDRWLKKVSDLQKKKALYGIRCCCVSPGPVLTRPGMKAMKTLLGRAAEPQEIIDTVLFVASDKATFITGENILKNFYKMKLMQYLRRI